MMLPHPSSIRNWQSTVNISPGFFSEVLQKLKEVPSEDRDCNLVFDGMAIRQQLCWNETEHKFMDYCDYDNNYNIEGNDIQAKEALVFMVVSLKGKWKWPIGYI